jgi:hypothetical protein
MGRTAGAHVVFGVDFEEAIPLSVGKDRLQMFVLEARANTALAFERPPAGICDPEASYSHFTCAYPHDLTTRCCEPVVDQVGYHVDSKTMGEQRCPVAAAQPDCSKYFKCPALFWAERSFAPHLQRQCRHRISPR